MIALFCFIFSIYWDIAYAPQIDKHFDVTLFSCSSFPSFSSYSISINNLSSEQQLCSNFRYHWNKNIEQISHNNHILKSYCSLRGNTHWARGDSFPARKLYIWFHYKKIHHSVPPRQPSAWCRMNTIEPQCIIWNTKHCTEIHSMWLSFIFCALCAEELDMPYWCWYQWKY